MVQLSTAAIFLGWITTASAFAPVAYPRTTVLRPLKASTVETPPSPYTLWGEKISNIRKVQEDFKKRSIPEFSVEISSADVGIASNDKDAQRKYFKDNAM